MRNRSMQHYLIRFSLADGEHIAGAVSRRAESDQEKQWVQKEIMRALNPATEQYPEGNPNFKLIQIVPVDDPHDVYKVAASLKEANPNRVGADELGLDTPNRILNEPVITETLAANQVPG